MTQINDFEVTSRIQQASAASQMFRLETLNCSKMIQDTISHSADRIRACLKQNMRTTYISIVIRTVSSLSTFSQIRG